MEEKLREEELRIEEAVGAFDMEGIHVGAVPYGAGHINQTYCVYRQLEDGDPKRYLLQKINTEVFQNVDGLMSNIKGVCEWSRAKVLERGGDPEREAMHLHMTRDGQAYYRDEDGGCWRCYDFIEGSYTLQKVENAEQFAASARSFADFFNLLADYPAHELTETIEKFHDTRHRYQQFQDAIARDSAGRVGEVLEEIQWVEEREEDCHVLMDLLERGVLPLRVTHNDTKLNNVLFDKATHEGLCVVDLDTVMPGLIVNDFGDAIRFGANDNAEDEPDISKVNFRLDLFETYAAAYLETCGDVLTQSEKKNLPWGAKMMTLECGIRFLTDYLSGDVYFNIQRPRQNLDRARTQFALVEQMEDQWEAMHDVIRPYLA